jgi:hypothetical protein
MKVLGTIIKIIFKTIGIILFAFVAVILGMMAYRAARAIGERRNTPDH